MGDLLEPNGEVPDERKAKRKWPGKVGIAALTRWTERHKEAVRKMVKDSEAEWQTAPREWRPTNQDGPETSTVVGCRATKTTRSHQVVQNGEVLEVNRLLSSVVERS